MKSNLNKITRMGYSNAAIALKCHVSVAFVHKNRKRIPHPLFEKALYTHFFTRTIPLFKSKIKDIAIVKVTFWDKLKRFINFMIYPFDRLYSNLAYRNGKYQLRFPW